MKLKLICLLFIILAPLLAGGENVVDENVGLTVSKAAHVYVYYDNQLIEILDEDKVGVVSKFDELIKAAREMPAFGVSLHNETIKELNTGLWLEFEFENTNIHGEMYFDKLLLKLEKDIFGFNVIRNYKGKYDGRCFYFNIDSSSLLNEIYNTVYNIVI